jgi:hypothetical protein
MAALVRMRLCSELRHVLTREAEGRLADDEAVDVQDVLVDAKPGWCLDPRGRL